MLTSAASQAPVPEDGYITTEEFVWKMEDKPSRTSFANFANSAPR